MMFTMFGCRTLCKLVNLNYFFLKLEFYSRVKIETCMWMWPTRNPIKWLWDANLIHLAALYIGCWLPSSFCMCSPQLVTSSFIRYLKLTKDVWWPTHFSAVVKARSHSGFISNLTSAAFASSNRHEVTENRRELQIWGVLIEFKITFLVEYNFLKAIFIPFKLSMFSQIFYYYFLVTRDISPAQSTRIYFTPSKSFYSVERAFY